MTPSAPHELKAGMDGLILRTGCYHQDSVGQIGDRQKAATSQHPNFDHKAEGKGIAEMESSGSCCSLKALSTKRRKMGTNRPESWQISRPNHPLFPGLIVLTVSSIQIIPYEREDKGDGGVVSP